MLNRIFDIPPLARDEVYARYPAACPFDHGEFSLTNLSALLTLQNISEHEDLKPKP